jgi:transcription-repair coupling factor (superfamily II helicase)
MMEEAVRELKGEPVTADVEPEIQLGFPAYIPDSYIADENQRLVFYRKLSAIRGQTDLDDIAIEMRERYGPIPPLADSFLRVMDLRRSLKDYRVVRAVLRNGAVTLQFHPDAKVDVPRLLALVRKGNGRFNLAADFQFSFRPEATDWDGLVTETKGVLHDMQETC